MRTTWLVATIVATLALPGTGFTADTDLDNPNMRDLPIQRGPIYGGKKHQPTREEVIEREQAKNSGAAAGRSAANQPAKPPDDLYQRVLKESQKSGPRSLDSDK